VVVPLLLLLYTAIVPAVAGATAYTANLTIVGADGNPLKGAEVILYDEQGRQYKGTTDKNGVASIEVPDNGTYLVEVKAGNYIIVDCVHVEGDTSKSIDASKMHYVNITSTPVSVDVSIQCGVLETMLNVTTNITVYASSTLKITYPEEVTKLPYTYVLQKIVYDGEEIEDKKTVTVQMDKNHGVTGVYEKTFSVSLNMWLAILLAIIIVVAVIVAFIAGGRKAKEVIEEWQKSRLRFVKRR